MGICQITAYTCIYLFLINSRTPITTMLQISTKKEKKNYGWINITISDSQPTRILFVGWRGTKMEARSVGTQKNNSCGIFLFTVSGRLFLGVGGQINAGFTASSSNFGVLHCSSWSPTEFSCAGLSITVLMGGRDGNSMAEMASSVPIIQIVSFFFV